MTVNIRRELSTSCGAAARVKPRARFCEPWVNPIQIARAPEGRKQSLGIKRILFTNSLSPLRGSGNLSNLTQGSQLALGLTLTAAPQLVTVTPKYRTAASYNFAAKRPDDSF